MDSSTKLKLTNIGKIDHFKTVMEKLTRNIPLDEKESTYILTCAILFIQIFEQNKKLYSYIELAYYIILKYALVNNDYRPLYDFAINFGFYPISNAIIKTNLLSNPNLDDLIANKKILNYKKNNYQRYKNLYAKNYVSKDEVELAYANYQQALAEVESAKAEVNASQATLNNNLTNLGYSKITSPVDGTVILRAVDVGQTVAASFNTPTLFEVAKDLTKMQIETSVSEADIGKIKVGQVAKYTLDGYQDKFFEGKVTQVRLASTTTNNVVTYTVIVSVDNSEGFVIPGMTANVSIITSDVKDALCVPNQALKFSPVDNTKKYDKQGVWVQTKTGLERYDVELGAFDDSKTQIISKDIKVGDKVCVGIIGGKTKKTSGMRPPRM